MIGKDMKITTFTLRVVRNYPISSVCILLIWYLSFFTPPKAPLPEVEFADKWAHIVMYGGTCGVIWAEYLRRHRTMVQWQKVVAWGYVAPILMSGLIEILQAYCTNGRRSGDWYDFLANILGCTLAAIIGWVVSTVRHRSPK